MANITLKILDKAGTVLMRPMERTRWILFTARNIRKVTVLR